MPAVKIPGAASIDVVAPARDPGVSASPEDFGAQIGSSMEHLGNAAVEIGVHLDRKRQAAAAEMAGPEAAAEFNLEATKARIAAGKAAPASGSAAQAGTDLDNQLLPIRQKIVAEKRAKFGLDDRATAHIDGHLTALQGHTVIGGVTDANNNIVQGFADRHDETVKTIAATALATGDVDSALKQVDDSVAAMRGVVPENYLTQQATKSKKYVVESAIAGARASGTKEGFDRAEELTKRFYGSTPEAPGSRLPGNVGQVIDQAATAGGVDPALARRVAQIESSGNPNARTGSYSGLFQLSAEGFAANGGKGDITNPAENAKAGIASLKKDIEAFRGQYGREPTPTEIYLSHQQGQGGLAAHLANPTAPAWQNMASTAEGRQKGQAWAKAAIWGNIPDGQKAQFGSVENVSSKSFMDVWKQKVEGGSAVKPELPDPERALKWNSEIAQARTKTLATESHDADASYTRQMIDANAGLGPLPSRSSIENDSRLSDDNRNSLLAKHDSLAGDLAGFQAALKKFEPGGGDFNQFDKTDVANVDRIFNTLGGDLKALQVVHDRTGMVPPSAAVALRGAMVSSDPQKVEGALQLASNLVSEKYPHTFENVNGGEQLKKDVDTFRHFVGLGFTSQEATKHVIEERNPEYQQKVTTRLKGQDVNAIVKKEVKESDLRSVFDSSFLGWRSNPVLPADQGMHDRAMGDYEELFREYYSQTGDADRAKASAQKQMKVTWGVTEVNGTKTLMKWAPENARVYAGIENPSDEIAKQAIEQVKNSTASTTALSSLAAADASLKLSPQEKALYQYHFTNLTGPGGVNNPDGSRSTLFATTVESDGRAYVIPTVYDGKILSSDDAWKKAKTHLDDFPAYSSETEAKARYDKLHSFMEQDTSKYLKNPHAFGLDVKRSQIRLQELQSPVTGERYMRGVPPAYLLSYEDKNGHFQQVKGDFYADPAIMRNEQTARRAEASAKIQARTGASEDVSDTFRLATTPTGRLGPTDRARKEELSKQPTVDYGGGTIESPEEVTGRAKGFYGGIADKVLIPGATRLGGKKKT